MFWTLRLYHWQLLQAFRHLYVIAAESRRVQTVDVDTGLPVYCPLEVTIKETEHYSETSFCEVTPCILPERSVVCLLTHLLSSQLFLILIVTLCQINNMSYVCVTSDSLLGVANFTFSIFCAKGKYELYKELRR